MPRREKERSKNVLRNDLVCAQPVGMALPGYSLWGRTGSWVGVLLTLQLNQPQKVPELHLLAAGTEQTTPGQ